MTEITEQELPSGKVIEIEIFGFINPRTTEPQPSFVLQTADREGFVSDQNAPNSLVISSQCNYPCATCSSLEAPD